MKRIKREHGFSNGHPRAQSSTPHRSERSGSGSSSESESELETPSEPEDDPARFDDDDANLRAYEEAKERGGGSVFGASLHVSTEDDNELNSE